MHLQGRIRMRCDRDPDVIALQLSDKAELDSRKRVSGPSIFKSGDRSSGMYMEIKTKPITYFEHYVSVRFDKGRKWRVRAIHDEQSDDFLIIAPRSYFDSKSGSFSGYSDIDMNQYNISSIEWIHSHILDNNKNAMLVEISLAKNNTSNKFRFSLDVFQKEYEEKCGG